MRFTIIWLRDSAAKSEEIYFPDLGSLEEQGLDRQHRWRDFSRLCQDMEHILLSECPPGARNQPQNTHYFIPANIRSRIYVVDAYTREVNQNINEYLHRQPFDNLDYATNYDIIVEQINSEFDTAR